MFPDPYPPLHPTRHYHVVPVFDDVLPPRGTSSGEHSASEGEWCKRCQIAFASRSDLGSHCATARVHNEEPKVQSTWGARCRHPDGLSCHPKTNFEMDPEAQERRMAALARTFEGQLQLKDQRSLSCIQLLGHAPTTEFGAVIPEQGDEVVQRVADEGERTTESFRPELDERMEAAETLALMKFCHR